MLGGEVRRSQLDRRPVRCALGRVLPCVPVARERRSVREALRGDEPLERREPVQVVRLAGVRIACRLRALDLRRERGAFTWSEWAATLAEVVAEVKARGEPDTGERYYEHWLAALERLARRKGLVTADGLEARRDAWDRAARSTPHGRPIELPREEPA